jgi:hypothetical protein
MIIKPLYSLLAGKLFCRQSACQMHLPDSLFVGGAAELAVLLRAAVLRLVIHASAEMRASSLAPWCFDPVGVSTRHECNGVLDISVYHLLITLKHFWLSFGRCLDSRNMVDQ